MPTVSVSSSQENNSHHLSLADGTTTHGYNFDSARDIQESTYTPSSIQTSQGRRGYDSFEAPYTSVDQTDWTGGRGQLKYQQPPEGDPTKFYDSYNMWTLTPGLMCPAPLWRFADGLRDNNTFMPGEKLSAGAESTRSATVTWQALHGTTARYFAHKFTTGANAYDVESITLLLRYYGTPGTLSVAIYSDSSNPDTAVSNSTVTLTATNISKAAPEGDLVGQLISFVPSTAPSLSATTDYWVVVWCADTDNTTNYWEIAYGDNGGTGATSNDGSAWSASDSDFYYRVTEAVADSKFHFFEYKRGLYAATEPLAGGAGKIYINGDRGTATGTSSATTLQDTTKSWTADEWIGAYVHIWNGTGEGQWRKITDNDTNTLTVTPAFNVTPVAGVEDTGSDYIIKGTHKWKDVTPSGTGAAIPSAPITDVLTLWGIIYVCQGEDDNIHRMREWNDDGTWKTFWAGNSATAVYGTDICADDSTNKALFLEKAYDPVNEWYIWYARNVNPGEWDSTSQTSVRKADDVTWGTDLDFTAHNVVPIGTRDYLITNITVYNNKLWVFKEDSIWFVDYDGSYDRAYPMDIGLDAIASPDNGRAIARQDLFLYFNWAFSVERLYGSTLDDIGPWKGQGMPSGASGTVVDLVPAIGWLFAAYDGGTHNQSSLLAYQNGWHTLFRAPSYVKAAFGGDKSNPRIRSVHWQSIYGEDATNYLWFECGGDIMFMQMPLASLNPSLDTNVMYAPESYVVHSRMDTGYAELEKYWDKIRCVSPAVDGTIYLDYQTNPPLESLTFTNAGSGTSSPSFNATIDQSRKRDIMVRTRISVSDIDDTAENTIEAIVVDGVARVIPKKQWTVRTKIADYQKTLRDEIEYAAYDRYAKLWEWAGYAQELTMRSVNKFHDANGSGRSVFIEPGSFAPEYIEEPDGSTSCIATFTLREL